MEKRILEFGKQIFSTGFCQETLLYPIVVKDFLQFFKSVLSSNDEDKIIGLCYSVSPFLAQHFFDLGENEILELWDNMILLCQKIKTPLEEKGFFESVSAMTLYKFKISQKFLDFLIDPDSRNDSIKVITLILLYKMLPDGFIIEHSKYFITLFTENLKDFYSLYLPYLIRIIIDLNMDAKSLQKVPNFGSNLMSASYLFIKNNPPNSIIVLINSLFTFRKCIVGFFNVKNEFVHTKLSQINSTDIESNLSALVPFIRLLPFFSEDDLDSFFSYFNPIFSDYLISKSVIPKNIISEFRETQIVLQVAPIIEKLYSICSQALQTEYYPAATFVLSIFCFTFLNHFDGYHDSILGTFVNGLSSEYPHKIPIIFSIYENVDSYIEKEFLITEKIIPLLINIISSTNDDKTIYWCFKTLWTFLYNNGIKFFPSAKSFLILYENLPHSTRRYFFKFLAAFVHFSRNNSTVNPIFSFAGYLFDKSETLDNETKSNSLYLAKSLIKYDDKYLNSFKEKSYEIAKELMFMSNSNFYDISFHYICVLSKITNEKVSDEIINRAIDICLGKEKCNNEIQLKIISCLSKYIDFVPSIALFDALLGYQNEENSLNVMMTLLKSTYLKINYINELFAKIISVSIKTLSAQFLSNLFLFVSTIITKISKENLLNLLLLTLQNRLNIFKELPPYYNTEFLYSFFTFVNSYINIYTKGSKLIVKQLMYWIDYVSKYSLPKLLKIFLTAIKKNLVDKNDYVLLINSSINRINKQIYSISIVRIGVALIMTVWRKDKNSIGIENLLGFLENIWDENFEDIRFITLLIPLFIEIFSDSNYNVKGDFEIFYDISNIIISESQKFNYPKLVNGYINMFQNKIPMKSLCQNTAIVLLHFLIKNRKTANDEGFSDELLVNMHKCVKHCIMRENNTMKFLANYFKEKNDEWERVKMLLKSPTLPLFK